MDADRHLLLLGMVPVPDGLEQLDGAVLARQAHRERREAQTLTGLAAAAALMTGVAGGLAPSGQEGGANVPFGPPVALTPLIALGRG